MFLTLAGDFLDEERTDLGFSRIKDIGHSGTVVSQSRNNILEKQGETEGDSMLSLRRGTE